MSPKREEEAKGEKENEGRQAEMVKNAMKGDYFYL